MAGIFQAQPVMYVEQVYDPPGDSAVYALVRTANPDVVTAEPRPQHCLKPGSPEEGRKRVAREGGSTILCAHEMIEKTPNPERNKA